MTTPSVEADVLLNVHDVRLTVAGRVIVTIPRLLICPGELVHVRGENGAGKTTLLRALAGEWPAQGTVHLQGHAPGSQTARARTAFVSTEPALLDDLTVEENLQFMAAAWHRPPAPALGLAHAFGLAPWRSAWPSELSRGTRQKVGLSLALGLGLPLTLLDEPFSTLDAASRDTLRTAIGERVRAGGAVLLTTHGDDLHGLPHRTLDLHQGELRQGSA